MSKTIIFQDSFLVSGIMCHQYCGSHVRDSLSKLDDLKSNSLLPADAEITIDAEPQAFGIHRIFITIVSDETTANRQKELAAAFRGKLGGFEIVDDVSTTQTTKITLKKIPISSKYIIWWIATTINKTALVYY